MPSVLAVFFYKGTSSEMDGVSTYLALTFGTLLSSQGTDASFVLTLAGFPPGASLRSCVSNLTRLYFRSVSGEEFESSGRWRGLSPFGGSDFIRDSESEFPPASGTRSDARSDRVPVQAEP